MVCGVEPTILTLMEGFTVEAREGVVDILGMFSIGVVDGGESIESVVSVGDGSLGKGVALGVVRE